MKKLILLLLILPACKDTIVDESGTQQSCAYQSSYQFHSDGRWLRVGNLLFDVTVPATPIRQARYFGHGIDTTFVLDGREFYSVSKWLDFDSLDGSFAEYATIASFREHPTQLASTNAGFYILRHRADSGDSWCSNQFDSVNDLEVYGRIDTMFSDTPSVYYLDDPQDLKINGSTLYVLDGKTGLRIYSLADTRHPALVTTIASITGYHMDLTPQSTLIVHSAAGLTQYDVSNPTSPVMLGKIQ